MADAPNFHKWRAEWWREIALESKDQLDKLKNAQAMLEANDADDKPREWVLTRPQARVLFGAEAIEGLPDNQMVRIGGEHCYLVGEKWPDVPTSSWGPRDIADGLKGSGFPVLRWRRQK